MRKIVSIFQVILLAFAAQSALANISPTYKNLNFDTNNSSIENFVLGRTCYSLSSSYLSLSCNPATLAEQTKKVFSLNLNLDNHTSEAWTYQKDLEKGDTTKLTDRLLENDKPFVVNASSTLWWQHEWWALSFVPARLQIASVTTNPAYPELSAHAFFQKEMTAQAGLYVDENPQLRLGANLRLIDNHEFRDSFAVLDVLSGSRKLEVKNNTLVYFEPALTYTWKSEWRPEVSFVLTQVEVYNSDTLDAASAKPEIGYSTTPDIFNRKLRTSFHYTSRPDVYRFSDRFRFGAIYEYDSNFSTSFNIAGDEFGAGFMARLYSLVLGVGAKSEVFHYKAEAADRVTSIMFQGSLYF